MDLRCGLGLELELELGFEIGLSVRVPSEGLADLQVVHRWFVRLVLPQPQHQHPPVPAQAVVEALQLGDAASGAGIPAPREAPLGVIVLERQATTVRGTVGVWALPWVR